MNILSLIKELEHHQVGLTIDGENLQLNFYKDEVPDGILDQIKENKSELIDYLKKYSEVKKYQEIPKLSQNDCYDISDAQRRLWVLSQFNDGTLAYNLSSSIELNDKYDIENFEKAIYAIIDRHEILRTVFKEDSEGEIKQWVRTREEIGINLQYNDLRKTEGKEALVRKEIEIDSLKPFDLTTGPLIRMNLYQLEESQYIFYCNMHHIVSDGWSMKIIVQNVLAYYEAFVTKKPVALEPLRIQYKEYAAWQLRQLQQKEYELHGEFWRNLLSGEIPALNLPQQKERPRAITNSGSELELLLPKDLVKKIKDFSAKNEGSLFITLLSLWKVLFFRYTGQSDIIMGTPVAGRDHLELEDQIGFYVNTLALRDQIDPKLTFSELYEEIKQNTLKALEHQSYPFDRLVKDLSLKRDTSRNAIFDVMVILQNSGDQVQEFEPEKDQIGKVIDKGKRMSRFDMEITHEELGNYLSVKVNYNTDIYDKSTIERFINHFITLTTKLINEETAIGTIDYISEKEREVILETFNNTEIHYPDVSAIDMFERQVQETPHELAVITSKEQYTYKELNDMVNGLVNHITSSFPVDGNCNIGVMADRSIANVIGMLAVLKIGACYVPVDNKYPENRIYHILEDANIKYMLTETSLLEAFDLKSCVCIDINSVKGDKNKYVDAHQYTDPSKNAFLIYTSGSTGKPKAVMQTYRTLNNLIHWNINDSGITSGLRYMQFTSFSFDMSLTDVCFSLCTGGTLYITNNSERSDMFKLRDVIINQGLEVLSFPYAVMNQFFNQFEAKELKGNKIKHVIVAGEQLIVNSGIEDFLRSVPDTALHNQYGPSETHVVTSYSLGQDLNNLVYYSPIGKPIANNQIYILDDFLKPVPYGVIGEIYIGGVNLANGYLNKPELSSRKFVTLPFKKDQKVYKSGDLGYWQEDGNIVYKGRKDEQVKIRGFRVELEEISQVLSQHEEIKDSVITVKEERLIAFIIPENDINLQEIIMYLKKELPEYMIPNNLNICEEFPLTSNGKVDKRALLSLESEFTGNRTEYVAPETKLEAHIVEIWETLFKKEKIGVYDDFFEMGGHSLMATKLVSEYHKKLNIRLELQELFLHTTIKEQAELLSVKEKTTFKSIPIADKAESYPLSYSQKMIWTLSQSREGSLSYVLCTIYDLEDKYDIKWIEKALYALIERHQILRTIFKKDNKNELRQFILPFEELKFKMGFHDVTQEEDPDAWIKDFVVNKDYFQLFDLEKGPLFRAAFFKKGENNYKMHFTIHHIIVDALSADIMMKDFMAIYESFTEGKTPQLPVLRIQYKDYAVWQQSSSENMELDKKYWLDRLQGDLPEITLPIQNKRPVHKTFNGQYKGAFFSRNLSRKVREFNKNNASTKFITLLSIFKVLIYHYTKQKDIIIGTPVHGRFNEELKNQIGCFINSVVLRDQIDPEETFINFFQKVKKNVLKAFNYQSYPFEKLLMDLEIKRKSNRSPIYDIIFVDQNTEEPFEDMGLQGDDFEEIEDLGNRIAKLDFEFHFVDEGDYTVLRLKYNETLYEEEKIRTLLAHFKTLIENILKNPNQKIEETSYITEKEKALLDQFNATEHKFSEKGYLLDLYKEHVDQYAKNTAVVYENKILDFKEFDELTDQLAYYLKEKYSLKSDDFVAISLERSQWLPISILAVIKAQAAYVPMPVEYPKERKEFIREDSNFKACIDAVELQQFISWKEENKYSKLDIPKENLRLYAIYTSGSTGTPKGVVNRHNGVLNRLLWMKHYLDVKPSDVFLQKTPYTFDVSVWEFLLPVITGSKLVVSNPDAHRSPKQIIDLIETHQVTIIHFVPSMLAAFLQELEKGQCVSLRHIICSGEVLNSKMVEEVKIKLPDLQIHNLYGPTEAAIDVTAIDLTNVDTRQYGVPIGKPVANTQIYIANNKLKLQGIKIPGELLIGGVQVADGYLNLPQITQEKFIPNPFGNGWVYRTGDIARWNDKGYIEYIGRIDNQVKIRGNRVELKEIEKAILSFSEEIIQAHVTIKEVNDEKSLIAYYFSKVSLDKIELKRSLKQQVPEYMIPNYFVSLKEIPITANGKINIKALPEVQEQDLIRQKYVGPSSKIEERLVKIWSEVLGVEKISVLDNFFDLGGDSINIVELHGKIESTFSKEITIAQLFDKHTIQLQANSLKDEIEEHAHEVINEIEF